MSLIPRTSVPAGPPGPTGATMPYTIPAVRFPDSSYLMDSAVIADRIEALYPSPSLSLSSPTIPEAEKIIGEVMVALVGWTMPSAIDKILSPRSAEYFRRTREESMGITMDKLQAEKGGESAWEDAAAPLKKLGDLLRKEEGPFVLGTTGQYSTRFSIEHICRTWCAGINCGIGADNMLAVSYADFHIVGLLQFLKHVDEKAVFERTLQIEPALKTLYEASAKWLERDDH